MLGAFKEHGRRIVRPALLRRTIDIERLRDLVNRARESGKNIICRRYVIRIHTRGIWLRHRDRTWEARIDAQGRLRACGLRIARVPGLRSREIHFSANGERMRAFRETDDICHCVNGLYVVRGDATPKLLI
jgi:hypothetical protein